jgi:spore maturation protein CgeB
VAFTGSYWQSERDIVQALLALPRHYKGGIYGKNWEKLPQLAHLNNGFVTYDAITAIYCNSKIVIDDANHVTKSWGAANSRVFDALAAGCLVITNSQTVSDELFDGALPAYSRPEHLASLLDLYLKDEELRVSVVKSLRNIVIARHCYSHRAVEFGLHLRLSCKLVF